MGSKTMVKCPHCGAEILFDDFDDVYDIEYDACEGHFWEKCAYTCKECNEPFGAVIAYSLKFEGVCD